MKPFIKHNGPSFEYLRRLTQQHELAYQPKPRDPLRLEDKACDYYGASVNSYHNFLHARSVLMAIDLLYKMDSATFHYHKTVDGIAPASIQELRLAAIWHDAVYIPRFAYNEEASAKAFEHVLVQTYIPGHQLPFRIPVVKRLIEQTTLRHHLCSELALDFNVPRDVRPLLDADLASLAEDYEGFVLNQKRIVLEQTGKWCGLHKLGESAKWLKALISCRKHLFHTHVARDLFETRACDNIAKFIEEVAEAEATL